MRTSTGYLNVATSLCVSLLLVMGSLNAFSTVLCFHQDGSVGFESSDGLGNCSPCSESRGSESSETRETGSDGSPESCLDLPISNIAGVPEGVKLSAPALRYLPSPYTFTLLSYSSWLTQALLSAVNKSLNNFDSDFHLRSSSLHIARSVLMLI